VVAALDEEDVRAIRDLIGPDVCYESLKQRLIVIFAVPYSACFRSFVQPCGLEDRRPTQLLRDMRSILPDGIGEDTLKQFWLQNLPATTSAIIVGQDGSLEDLAARVDRVMEADTSFDLHTVNSTDASTDRFRAMENAIAALITQVSSLVILQSAAKPFHDRSRSRSKSRSKNNNILCFYHDRFGADAKNCKPPCSFKPAEN